MTPNSCEPSDLRSVFEGQRHPRRNIIARCFFFQHQYGGRILAMGQSIVQRCRQLYESERELAPNWTTDDNCILIGYPRRMRHSDQTENLFDAKCDPISTSQLRAPLRPKAWVISPSYVDLLYAEICPICGGSGCKLRKYSIDETERSDEGSGFVGREWKQSWNVQR